MTLVAFFWLYLRAPARFTQWRNVLAFTTGLAIVGFSLFPLMPPRLLDEGPPYGGAALAEEHDVGPYGFTDTLADVGGLWSFDSGTVAKISNQYAAMPSLHIAWSTWCTCALWPLVRRKWARFLLVLYPLATLFCIVVTANHYFLDAVGGLVCLGIGYVAGTALDTWWHERRPAARTPAAAVLAQFRRARRGSAPPAPRRPAAEAEQHGGVASDPWPAASAEGSPAGPASRPSPTAGRGGRRRGWAGAAEAAEAAGFVT